MSETWKKNTKRRFIDSLKIRAIIVIITFGFFGLILALNYLTTGDIKGDKILKKENIEFGFNLDRFKVQKDTIRFGDSFGEIMLRNKLSYSQIYNIVQSIKDSFDVRWLTAGKPYTILSSKDSLANPQYFIYQPNRLNYVVIDFSNFDSISAYNKKKPFKIVKKTTSGIIDSSLSETMDENGLPWELINQLSDIYAWNKQLIYYGNSLTELRYLFFEKTLNNFRIILNSIGATNVFDFLKHIEISFFQGWEKIIPF